MKTVYQCLCAASCLWLLAYASTARSIGPKASVSVIQVSQDESTVAVEEKESKVADQFSQTDLLAAQKVADSLGVAEWLGPLAPLALSPFFGIACLSGLSLFGGQWFSSSNPFLGASSPLHSEVVFVAFLILTLVTSLPRLTKLSKPFVQMTDQLEAWAGIITMLVLKFLVTGVVTDSTPENQVVMLGMVSATADLCLMIAAALNVLVINSVKFFCEMCIWLIPVPLIDAAFEVLNKSVCASLMLVYGYSPYLATCLNLSIFLIAAIVFRWVYRQEVYFRTVLLDAVVQKILPAKMLPANGLVVFLGSDMQGFKYRSRCVLTNTELGWQLVKRRLFRSDIVCQLPSSQWTMSMSCGLFAHTIHVEGADEKLELTFTRKYHQLLPELCQSFSIVQPTEGSVADKTTRALLPR
ncbi:MAG: hypothetical protein ABJZ55_16250 [Fuerstiella sp.]